MQSCLIDYPCFPPADLLLQPLSELDQNPLSAPRMGGTEQVGITSGGSCLIRTGGGLLPARCGWGAENRRGRTQVGKMHGFASPPCLQDGRQFWSPGYHVREFIEDKSKAPCALFASLCLLRSIAKKSVPRNNNILGVTPSEARAAINWRA